MSGYLFYSDKCDTCTNLRTYMNNHKLLNIFKTKNIDVMSIEEINQLGLQTVPTILIVHTLQNGETRQGIYEGENACNWAENMVMNRRKSLMQQTENTRKLIEMNNMKKKVKEGVLDYSSMETSGISDDYAYFASDMNLDKQLDISQPKTFLPFRQDNQYRILSIPQDSKEKGYKLTYNDQLKMASDLENVRKIQDEQIKMVMHQDQINSVMTGENKNFQ